MAELVYGTLRNILPLDRAIESASDRGVRSIDPEALAILRMGAYQILFTRIPPHAAVSESVNLSAPRHRGFVNAVLRRVSREGPPPARGHGDEAVSARTGLSSWAVGEVRRLLPREEVEEAAAGLAAPAALTLRANRCRMAPDELERELRSAGYEPARGRHHPEVLRVAAAVPDQLPGFERGWFAIQDEASALVGTALEPQSGERILDACAGPGGKASYLACGAGAGPAPVAADVRLGRVELVRSTLHRMGLSAHLLVQDARRPALRGAFDAVLVDAPCSGLGAARRRPELLWRPAREDLSRLARLQVAILAGVAALVRPGGRLVYSVCTFPRAETDAVLSAFLAKQPAFEPADVPGPGGPAPIHRLWPHRHGTDAMFYAGLRRR